MNKTELFKLLFMMAAAAALVLAIDGGINRQPRQGAGDFVFAAPELSAESGFYAEPFELEITVPEGALVYYTLDGSAPREDSRLYTEPVAISYGSGRESDVTYIENMQQDWMNGEGETHSNLATVIRAAAVYEGGVTSDIVTATYFVGQEKNRDHLIVSLVADPEDLFGDNGIYVTGRAYDEWYLGDRAGDAPTPNFLQHGEEWERPAVMELFQGKSLLQQPVGIRIQGASMREGANKRFSVYARKKYGGSGWFDTPIFGFEAGRTHSFMLRSGFMNGYIQYLVQDRDIASAQSREVIVYLNGALWYITIAQEKYSEKYFQEKYGVDEDNLVIAKAGAVESGRAEEQAMYQAMYDFLNTHDMSDPVAYEGLDRIMDIQSYIDFSCVNLYFANLDYNENKNIYCWRARKTGYGEYEDGRWRWGLYDMDLENLDYGVRMEEINTFTMDTHYAGGAFNTRPMYVALKQNPLFCRQFVLSFMDMVNTDFTVERAAGAMEDWGVTMEWWGMPADWVENFFPARTEAITGYLAEEFGLTGTRQDVRLSVSDAEAGYLTLNTITPDLSEGEWTGSYFTDHPVTVTAVANEGYRFAGWSGDVPEGVSGQQVLTVEIPEGGLKLQAVFQKEGDRQAKTR